MKNNIQLINDDCLNSVRTIKDGSVDVILTDPPYLYLKNQKLERPFDEHLFFAECKRILNKKGFIVLFGRGTSFYRWNTILADLGFQFKEEVIWSKGYSSSPLMAMSRVHETVSLHTLKGKINKVKVPYLEMKQHDINSICQDVKRLMSVLGNPRSMDAVKGFLENNKCEKVDEKPLSTTVSSPMIGVNRGVSALNSMQTGLNEKSIIRTDLSGSQLKPGVTCQSKISGGNRCADVLQSIEFGLNEKSIIKVSRNHYTAIHPTQKPVRLIERILSLVIPKDKSLNDIIVCDFFGGSFSTMEAVSNMGMQGISCEIDVEYFEAGKKRIESLQPKQSVLF